jgi:hypothetical protein
MSREGALRDTLLERDGRGPGDIGEGNLWRRMTATDDELQRLVDDLLDARERVRERLARIDDARRRGHMA